MSHGGQDGEVREIKGLKGGVNEVFRIWPHSAFADVDVKRLKRHIASRCFNTAISVAAQYTYTRYLYYPIEQVRLILCE